MSTSSNLINRFLIISGIKLTSGIINNSVKQIEEFLKLNNFREDANSLAGMFRYYSNPYSQDKSTTVLSISATGKVNKIKYIQ
ncbi:MAG: hypothetical protein JWN76_1431 [Chitinophagaceae bacterium]|nr:hypothetical protein [Chitinophagaceae bacterium]